MWNSGSLLRKSLILCLCLKFHTQRTAKDWAILPETFFFTFLCLSSLASYLFRALHEEFHWSMNKQCWDLHEYSVFDCGCRKASAFFAVSWKDKPLQWYLWPAPSPDVVISFLDSDLCSSSQLSFSQSFTCSMIYFAGPLSTRPVLSHVCPPLLKFPARFADEFVHAFVTADLDPPQYFRVTSLCNSGCLTMQIQPSDPESLP